MRSLIIYRTARLLGRWGILPIACLSLALALSASGSYGVAAQSAVSCSLPNFEDATRFQVGRNPRAMAVADFNGDGRLDVAVANAGANDGDTTGSVLILLGDAGTLFKQGVSVNAGLNPRAVATGDFNKDGKLDLVTLVWGPNCCTQGAVTVLLGDGVGGFTPTGNLTAVGGVQSSSGIPTSIVVADFNGDGNADVAVMTLGSPSAGVSVLLGNGAGGFAAPAFHPTAGNGGQVLAGDFNGDGKLDLATADLNGFGVSVLLGDGAGGFGSAITTNTTGLSNPSSIVAGDFNGDGKLDLVAVSDSVRVLTGDGTGKFTIGASTPVVGLPETLASGDFNNDGKPDVAVATTGGISVLLGDGAGGFGATNNYGTGFGSIFVASGDFDGDGKADLLAADALDNDLSFLKGEGTGGFVAAGVYAAGLVPFHAASADFNKDGIPDLAVANIGQNRVTILLGSGGGKFTPAPDVITTDPGFVAMADFNGDGKSDLAIANSSPFFTTVSIALGDGAGGFSAPKSINVGTNPRSIAVADFNNDGNADLAVANSDSGNFSVLLGDGNGGFTSLGEVAVGGSPNSIITADFNHDCNADLVILGDGNGGSLLLGDGTGKFSAPISLSAPPGTRSVAAGDLDGDGNTDLVFANRSTAGSAVVFLGNGAGGFGAPISFGAGRQRELVTLADFNGDGKLDIALLNSATSISVLLNGGGNTFSQPVDFPIAGATTFFAPGDFSGDGSPDLITAGSSSDVMILFNACPAATRAGRSLSIQFAQPCYAVQEGKGVVQIGVTRSGNLSGDATVDYFTSNGTASDVSDYIAAIGRLHFAPNESDKTLKVLINDDSFVEPAEVFHISLTGASGAALGTPASATIVIKDNDVAGEPNPITLEASNPAFFVRQHYADFLNREPDASGLQFWTNEITKCGTDVQCQEVKRVNVSAAFFLSIEFQQTGYLIEKIYKVSFGDATGNSTLGGAHQLGVPVVRLDEFLRDTQEVGSTPSQVIVGQGNWQQQLEDNKNAFALDFVGRQRFATAFPASMTADQFVSELDSNAGGVLSAQDKAQLDSVFGGPSASSDDTAKRAQVLRQVAENSTLQQREFNRAFVLMQYFGYLRRNPDDSPDSDYTGYDFWLSKLDQFNGNFVQAEMVKAFISSTEYRQRFGQP